VTTYVLRVREPEARRIEVELSFDARGASFVDVRMPVWTPGSYLIREHQRHVDGLHAADEAGRPLSVEKVDKHTWRIGCEGRKLVRVEYRLACFELTVRTSHVDPTHAFINPAAACMFAVGREHEACLVRLEMRAGWRAYTALPERDGAHRAHDYDELADSPFELGPDSSHSTHEFQAAGAPHQLVVWGRGDLDAQKAVADIARVVEAEAALFGGLPYREKYVFILLLSEKGRGGLEHRHSCALLAPRFSFSARDGYEDFLELVAHEFFHLWNVKRLRPAVFTPYDWTRENHTGLLWAMEGLTRCYELIVLRRAGLVSAQRFLELWAELASQLLRTPGRLRSTLLQASYDAWIKFYRPDETSPNTTVSYYLKGGVVGLLLDLEIRRRTSGRKSLDDLMRLLYERYGTAPGLPEDGVERAAMEVVGEDPSAATTEGSLKAWLERALRTTEELPLEQALAGVGLRAKIRATEGPDDKGGAEVEPARPKESPARGWHGAQVREQSGVVGVSWVAEGSPAQRAGLGAGDDIVAIDGYRGELKQRLAKALPGAKLKLSVFRMDELVELELAVESPPADTVVLVADPKASADQLALRRAWLGADWPESAPV
jgi:predicted metalloprotease with PDZ domain